MVKLRGLNIFVTKIYISVIRPLGILLDADEEETLINGSKCQAKIICGDGYYRILNPDGKVEMEMSFGKGRMVNSKYFSAEGLIEEENVYHKGAPHEHKRYFKSGKIQSEYIVDSCNKPLQARVFDEEGNLKSSMGREGERIESKEFHGNGKLKSHTLREEKTVVFSKHYDENGVELPDAKVP